MPWVTVWPTPNGLPMASTTSPTCERIGIAELDRRKALVAVLDPQHREIGARVAQHDLGLELTLVGERNLDLVGALDDVMVGDDQAARIDDDAGAERALHLRAIRPAEEAAEQGIVEQRIAVGDGLGGVDVDHRRGHPLHHRRVGERELRGRGRHRPILCGGRDGECGGKERQERGHKRARC